MKWQLFWSESMVWFWAQICRQSSSRHLNAVWVHWLWAHLKANSKLENSPTLSTTPIRRLYGRQEHSSRKTFIWGKQWSQEPNLWNPTLNRHNIRPVPVRLRVRLYWVSVYESQTLCALESRPTYVRAYSSLPPQHLSSKSMDLFRAPETTAKTSCVPFIPLSRPSILTFFQIFSHSIVYKTS